MMSFSTTIYQASLLVAYRIMCQPSYQANLIFPEYLVFCTRIDHEILHHAYIIPSLLLDPLISSNPIFSYISISSLVHPNSPQLAAKSWTNSFTGFYFGPVQF